MKVLFGDNFIVESEPEMKDYLENDYSSESTYSEQESMSMYKKEINNVEKAQFLDFEEPTNLNKNEQRNLDLLMDIPLNVSVELGRTKKTIKEILELNSGSIVELDKLAGEPVDILVNNRLIAKGEVVVIDENFGVRISDIINQSERIKKLR